MIKKSIKVKVLAYFLGVVILVLAIIWLGIKVYIEDFYYGKKIETMQETVKELSSAFENEYNEKIIEDLEYIGYQFGGKISIYNGTSVITILNRDLNYQRGKLLEEIKHRGAVAYVYEIQYPVSGTKWLVYGDQLFDGTYAILEIPIESIENTLDVVESFFSYLAVISIIIAGFSSIIFSKSISEPVADLNEIAKEMGRLNFNKKYTGTRKDELGQLGLTLNEITSHLEKTIYELQHELDKEKNLDALRKNFVAQVSHELQTPLSVINGYVEALEDGIVDTDEERQYYYEIIEDETRKMSKMVRELLDLSQFEAGTFKMNMESIDLMSLLDVLANKYEKIAQSRNIHWEYRGDQDAFFCVADPVRLEQGITNIIHNAFKHTQDFKRIIFMAKRVMNGLAITIENEGSHIEEGQLDRIWESFVKGASGVGKQGTGLGLAIAANIFKAHNMTYRAYNSDLGVVFELMMEGSDESN